MTDDTPSKTRRKKDMHALQALGERLVELPAERLAELVLPERLLDAVLEARRTRGFEARRRQMQYIGRVMREVDPAPIAARVDAFRAPERREVERQHAIERWRVRLLAGEDALTEFARACPGADLQRIRTLIRQARREQAEAKPPRAYRELFRLLRDALPPADPPAPAGEAEPPAGP